MPTVHSILGRRSLGVAIHRRARILGSGLLATMIVSIIATAIAPSPALADPVADKKAQAAALAQKIDSNARQVEVLAEQFNGAQFHLAQVQQQLADAQKRLDSTRADVERNRAALAAEAVVAYIHGGVTTSGSLQSFSGSVDLAVQQGYFQLATNNQADALDALRKSEKTLHQQQSVLQTAQQDSQAALVSVTSRQQAVQAVSAASQATLSQVQGDLVQLVAQQQAQIAARQQAQVQGPVLVAQAKLAATSPLVSPPAGAGAAAAAGAGAAAAAAGAGASQAGPTAAPTTATPSSPTKVTSPPTTKPPLPPPPPPPPASRGAGAAIAYARAQLGKPYQWGAAGPGSFDCSGLTMRAWGAAGVSLPHYARGQYANTAHVAIADLQPGDLVFFGSDLHHVGLYIGGGQMIHAPQSGEVVNITNIFWPDLQPYGGRPG